MKRNGENFSETEETTKAMKTTLVEVNTRIMKTTLVGSLGCAKCNICFIQQIALVPACFATKNDDILKICCSSTAVLDFSLINF
jgi:hypothetical protein